MNPYTLTSDLLLDLDESIVTDALATIGSEYIKLPMKSTPAEPTRAVLLYFDEWLRTYVLERVDHPGPNVHLDCRRTDVPEWLVTGDGPEVVAGLLAHERTVVDMAAPTLVLNIEIAPDRPVTFRVGDLFWGRWLDADRRLTDQIETVLDTDRFRENFQNTVRCQLDGDLQLELTGTLPVNVAATYPPTGRAVETYERRRAHTSGMR